MDEWKFKRVTADSRMLFTQDMIDAGAVELLAHAEFSAFGEATNLHLAKVAFKAAINAALSTPIRILPQALE